MNLTELETPCLLVDLAKTQDNIERMQAVCNAHGVQLRPHVKTHKMVEIARRQLAAGATGLVCSKISEAEALLPSGVRSIFIANSIVDPLKAPRLRRLSQQLDELVLAVTSHEQAEALNTVLSEADLSTDVLLAIDTGLAREGSRSLEDAAKLADIISGFPRMRLKGIYTHEGHAYRCAPSDKEALARDVWERLQQARKTINPELEIWPGCSVTAAIMATLPDVESVRPGAYVFGDLSHCDRTLTMSTDQVSLLVVVTVVDKPTADLALIDAGSKTFSSDRAPDTGLFAIAADGRDLSVSRLSEEHGFVTGEAVANLSVGERIAFIPTHVCPVVNLADEVRVLDNDGSVYTWKVEARGAVQ